ncbi:thermonuclease family protein [Pseudovibrio brasiliensis]|uniref:Thermonuclease family protein n=1 Tax=Pseudovibrio brasiliensis TaxID=1898042 RepID=A0ABX8ARS6_9HYPH|nr:thermonuclease family protein [Pseudovibrio brasiliensis]QUS57372.1 thermonuclease family protein [Pseudovibrio brasiliensis]
MKHLLTTILCLTIWAGAQQTLAKSRTLPGPYKAQTIKVIDADTLRVFVEVWPMDFKRVDVRLNGIDTPEKRSTGCSALYGGKAADVPEHIKQREKQLGLKATRFVKAHVKPQDTLLLSDVKLGKYAGRALGRLALSDGRDLAELLIQHGHAVTYDGGTKAAPWCLDN